MDRRCGPRADDEWHTLRHQRRDEGNVTGQTIQLGHRDLAFFAAFNAAFNCGWRSRASDPLPVSTSVNSATMMKPSALANAATAARCPGQGRNAPAVQ